MNCITFIFAGQSRFPGCLTVTAEKAFANIGKLDFIVLLSRHLKFGWIVDPWMAETYREISLQLVMRCSTTGLADGDDDISGARRQIVDLARSFSDHELARQFSPRGTTPAGFLQKINDEIIARHIRPFIDLKMNDILLLAIKNSIPVYLRHEGPVLTPSMRVTIPMSYAEPWFCFTRSTENSTYMLEVSLDEQPLDLMAKETFVISDNPCWFLHSGRLLRFREGFEGKKLVPFLTKKFITIPASAEKKYFETFIMKTLKTGQVRAEGFAVTELDPEKSMELSLEIDWQGRVLLVTRYLYGKWQIMRGKKQQIFTELKLNGDDYTFYRTIRQSKWEDDQYSRCLELDIKALNENAFVLPYETGITENDLYAMTAWICSHRSELDALGIRIVQEGTNFFLGEVSSTMQVVSGLDWFDVKAVVKFGSLEIPFSNLRKYILDGIREFPLPNGEIAVLPPEWFTRYHDLFAFSQVHDHNLRVSNRHFSLVSALECDFTAQAGEVLHAFEFETGNQAVIPRGLNGTLRPYQSEGLQWLQFLNKHRFGGCLADDMGLGKTIQTLALMLSAKEQSQQASLIIMPASLIHNWRNEISRFAPSLSVMVHTGPQRTRNTIYFDSVDLVLTTYGTCRNDINLLENYKFHYIILDESQVIKNPEAQISQTVYSLKAGHKLVLTGTPIENSLTDLWSQMEFLNPGLLGQLSGFKKIYVNSFDPVRDEDKVLRLQKLVSPFILRRRKAEVEPDLPELSIEYRYCEMSDAQQQRYETEKSAIRNEILAGIENGSIPASSVQVLKALIRLRQTACHPLLVDRGYQGDSGKLEEVMRNLEILHEENQKVLIFSSFVEHLKLLANRFRENSWGFSLLTGSTNKRENVISGFKDRKDNNFFLISLKAGGTGLNLTEAGYVFMLDPWWNPAAELQAINRAHRIGQDKKVIAYKFISKETIEEKILVLQQHKQALSDTLIPAGNPLKDLPKEVVSGLFI